jgi:hypothetical protein
MKFEQPFFVRAFILAAAFTVNFCRAQEGGLVQAELLR